MTAFSDGSPIGELSWYFSGMIDYIYVKEEFRRRGIATAMWNEAARLGMELFHSPERTVDGDAWAHSVGGKITPLMNGMVCR